MNNIQEECQTWIFQANPNVYKIHYSLREYKQEYWNLRQYTLDIKHGDRVLIWICGSQAGIYAQGTIISETSEMMDSPRGQSLWNSEEERNTSRPRVLVRYDRLFLEKPLLKKYLLCDPFLWSLSIIKQPRGTNFRVKPKEWDALKQWIALIK